MATLSSVTGFYYQVGSIDYPSNYSPDHEFGFDTAGATNAVFKYSVNDCEKALASCRSLIKRSTFNSANTNVLLADNSSGLLTTVDIAPTDSATQLAAWNAAFRVMEWIYNNQSSANNNPISSGYYNYGDELLANPTFDSKDNQYYTPNYVPGSLVMQGSTHPNRLAYAKFTITGFSSGNVTFYIYFDADAFVERSDNITYAVYRYEDLESPDDQISASEFESQIISKQFNTLAGGKFKSWAKFVVDKHIKDGETVEEQFFVYSSIKAGLTEDVMKVQVKQYLTNKYDDMTYLRYTYPTLFSENEIRIIPLYDNTIETTGGTSYVVHPLSVLELATVLTAFGFSISTTNADYRATEIFHVGPGAGWNPGNTFRFNFPLIAVEVDSASGIILPISKRFPSYKPVYGETVSGDAGEFHYILITVLGYLMGLNQSLTNEFKSQYSVSETINTTLARKELTFTFAGNIWTVYGPNSATSA